MSISGIGPAYVPQVPQSTQLPPGMEASVREAISARNDHTNAMLSQLQANMAGKEDVGKLRDELGSLKFSLQNQMRLMAEQGNTMSPAQREALEKQITEGLARAVDLKNRIVAHDTAAAMAALAAARSEIPR